MTLYFENSYGKRRVIGNPNSQEDAIKIIYEFLDGYNYKSYYCRSWEENGETWFDVGSWSEAFILKGDC